MTALLSAALSWLDRGFPVFPLKPRGKVPLGPLVPHGLKDATRDPALVRDWWRRDPEANIGLRTGDGYFVLDLDGADAEKWFVNAAGRHGAAPKTLTVRTAQGWHLYFKTGVDVPNSAGRIATRVDVRGVGGYVVAAPSIHPGGAVYTIRRNLPIAEAPRWLVDAAIPDPAAAPIIVARGEPWDGALGQVAGIVSLVANARQGERNRITFWAACRFNEMVCAGLITPGLARDLLLQSASRCGLTGMEILTTARSASKTGRRR